MSIGSTSPPLRELNRRQIQWIGAGYVMCMSSMAGQTVFIAQFNSAIRAEFALSHGGFAFLYTIATLASSICLIWAGALADRIAPRTLALICLAGLAMVAAGMSQVFNIFTLGLALFGLRFFGQGMMVHIAMTTMSRWFNRFRGRALSFAQLGVPSGEAIFPFVTTLAIAAFGWKHVWLGVAAIIMLVLFTGVATLLRDPPDGQRAKAQGVENPDGDDAAQVGQQWTRRALIRDPLFLLCLPGVVAPSGIITLFLFHQAHLTDIKGWELTHFTALIPTLSVTVVTVAIISGAMVDRFGAWRIMPVFLLPLGLGCLVLAVASPLWHIALFLVLFGMSVGMMAPVVGALWAELYGTANIGSIRALVTSASVFATAIGPGIAGALIDGGFELDRQAYFYAAYCFAAAAGYFFLLPQLKSRVAQMDAERLAATSA